MPTANRIKGTFSTVGTGDITFAAAAGHVDLSALAGGAAFSYFAGSDTEWEIGVGTKIDATSFSRGAVEQGTNGASLVSFSAGVKTFFVAPSAADINALLTAAGVATLTNKRITKRVGSIVTPATAGLPLINTDLYDVYRITALAADVTSFTTNLSGTPVEGDELTIEVQSTAIRNLAWGTKFESSTIVLPAATVANQLLTVSLKYNTVTAKWRCIGVA